MSNPYIPNLLKIYLFSHKIQTDHMYVWFMQVLNHRRTFGYCQLYFHQCELVVVLDSLVFYSHSESNRFLKIKLKLLR